MLSSTHHSTLDTIDRKNQVQNIVFIWGCIDHTRFEIRREKKQGGVATGWGCYFSKQASRKEYRLKTIQCTLPKPSAVG